MGSTRVVGDAASRLLESVIDLERELQTPGCRADAARLDELLSEDFAEIGASGRVWSRTEIFDLLAEEPTADGSAEIEMSDVHADELSEDLIMVQWDSRRGERRARRTSLWRREPDGWRLRHHQGTLLD